jgi:5-methyltetrahydrofolate--homocysteine methyltransferase
VQEALRKEVDPKVIVLAVLTAAMDILGPHLSQSGVESKGKFVISTVAGDLHDIGKNIVAIMLKGAGYEVIDLGTDVSAEKVVETVAEHQAPFLCLSALLTTTMRVMKDVIGRLEAAGPRDKVRVMIGGTSTSPAYAYEIKADAHCKDAFQAIEMLQTWRRDIPDEKAYG